MQVDVNIDRLVPRIASTLNKLLIKNDFDSLTVTDISREAGFSRQYFYRAFADKHALCVELFAYDMKTGIDEQTSQPSYHKVLEHIMKNARIYKSIFQSSYSSYLFDLMFNSAMELIRATADHVGMSTFTREQDNSLRLYLLGATSMLVKFLTGGEHFSKDELEKIFYDNAPSFLAPLKRETVPKDFLVRRLAKYLEDRLI